MLSSSPASRVLVVDDEVSIREGLKTSLQTLGYEVETAESGEKAIHQFRQNPGISFVISDYRMPGLNGFDVLKEIKKSAPQTKVVMMTGYGSIHHAVEAMQLGADDYLSKPFHFDDIERVLAKNSPKVTPITMAAIVTQDENFVSVLRKAERAARSNAPILIEGPSGTGKELLARQIHEWSHRQSKPWVAINCAALPSGLLESELFGYERGAFTGAMERKLGRFEQANTGTLLLDEIGELDPILQAKLLRVLQEGEVDRLGGRKSTKVDVRIIATTNRNLEQLVREGKFREDLYFRLYGVKFCLPSLKSRPADISLLAQEFLRRHSTFQETEIQFAEGVLEKLEKRSWPGNIRELERAVERAAVLCDRGVIEWRNFDFGDEQDRQNFSQPVLFPLGEGSSKSIKDMEREIILKALDAHAGNRTHTAKALGMSLRTLRHKIKQYRDSGETVSSTTTGQKGLGNSGRTAGVDAELAPSWSTPSDGSTIA